MAADLAIGDVARRSGVAVSAIRFYETRGLIESWRNPGNQRRYSRDVLRRVAIIKVAQRAGIGLDEVADAFAGLPRDRAPTRDDWNRLSRAWRQRLDERVRRMERLRDQLDDCIGCGCLSLDTCPLRNSGDRLGRDGPGPRLLDPI